MVKLVDRRNISGSICWYDKNVPDEDIELLKHMDHDVCFEKLKRNLYMEKHFPEENPTWRCRFHMWREDFKTLVQYFESKPYTVYICISG